MTCCLREYFESNTANYSNNFVSFFATVGLGSGFPCKIFFNSDINEAN